MQLLRFNCKHISKCTRTDLEEKAYVAPVTEYQPSEPLYLNFIVAYYYYLACYFVSCLPIDFYMLLPALSFIT